MKTTEPRVDASKSRQQIVDRIIMFASAAVALLYLYTFKEGQLPVMQQRGIILAFCYTLIFIKFPMLKGRAARPLWTIAVDVVLVATTILMIVHLINVERIMRPGIVYEVSRYDMVLGTLLVVSTLEATRRVLGLILPVIAAVFFLYSLFGHLMPPGMLWHMPIEYNMNVYYIVLTTDGIFGIPLAVISTIVIGFLVFAAMLQRMGLMRFFVDLSTGLMGKHRGGPAKIAVVSSAFMAMLSGSAVANVVSTGSFTIPLMKSIGYRPNFAGAVEACASTGGITTPPVMGAAAFIIAETLGISYWAVVVAAAIPAVLYYWGVYTGVDLEAMKLGLKGLPKAELPSVGRVLLKQGYMIIPVFVLLYYLGYVRSSAMLAAFWGIVAILVVGMIGKETRKGIYGLGLVRGLSDAIKDCMLVVATVACAGIVIGTLVVTGLGMKMSTILVTVAGGNLLVLLILAAIVCIILGMGMTVTAVYILVAMIVAPAITRLGVPPLAAHLFVFYMANLSNITPPVCVAVFAACGISGGDPWKTGWQSVRLGAVLFMLPFFFAYQQSLIMQGRPDAILISLATALVGVAALAFAFANHSWWGRIGTLPRVLLGVGGLALIYPGLMVSIGGVALVAVAVLYQAILRRRSKAALAADNPRPVQESEAE